jgi:LCP family protein required for cell wall assembly
VECGATLAAHGRALCVKAPDLPRERSPGTARLPDGLKSAYRSPRRRSGSPYAAAFLSFLWPGLGHLYAGRQRGAALFALPMLGIVLVVAIQALVAPAQLAALLLDPSSALTIVILILLVAAWRLLAMADAMVGLGPRNGWRSGRSGVLFALLAVGVLAVHLPATYLSWAFYDAGSRIFVAGDPDESPRPTAAPGESPNPDDEYLATPIATPPNESARINILLTGVDSAETRSHALTDTLMVVSIDPDEGTVDMLSFPRDIAQFELSDGRTYRGKINSLMTYARLHPDEFPAGPMPTLMQELGHLLGTPIHYFAAVDLSGFRRMIDVVGGVTIDNPRAIDDPAYDWLDGTRGFQLAAGPHTLDGRTALAYVRSRQGVGDSDYTRSARQQQILVALRAKLTKPGMVPKLPAILDAAAETLKTNFPADRVGEMLGLAQGIEEEQIASYVLGPPYAVHPPLSQTDGVWILRLDLERIADLSIELFGDDSRYATTAR